ncbi:hypothetical protein Tco_1317279 [Tanacetum coccineum]
MFKELLEQRRKHFASERAEEKRNKPPTKTQQKKIMITYLKNMEETTEVDDDQEAAKVKELMKIVPDEEEVLINAIPLAVKSLRIVDWKIHKEGKTSYYQIVRADVKSQMYLVFSHMLQSFDREDLEDLYKLSTFLEDAVYADIHVGREEVSSYSTYTFNDGRIVGIKSFLMLFGVAAALNDVNVAQSKLVLLENFNENYSKCLRLLVKLQLPVQSYYF